MKKCLINRMSGCGRENGNPVCWKCGMDERAEYSTRYERWDAESRGELRYLRAYVEELEKLQAPPVIESEISNDSKVAGEVFRDAPWAPEMVALPSGKFLMGSPENEPGRHEDEGSPYQVTIGYKLAIGKYPVTFEEWDACLVDGGTTRKPSDEKWGRGKRPVINVSWEDAQQYIAWLNKKLGITPDNPFRYRLPSEAEWEYACRAGSTTMFSTPDGLISSELANYDAARTFEGAPRAGQSSESTTPVGSYPANAWGLHDMHGNVWEWTGDAINPKSGDSMVVRGGSWDDRPWKLRSASRDAGSPNAWHRTTGFRLARNVS